MVRIGDRDSRRASDSTPVDGGTQLPIAAQIIRRGGRVPLAWGVAVFALLLGAVVWAAPGTPGFPAPDRPVAGIISPEYSNEKTRDSHGEADRVLNRLNVMPGQRVADIGAGLGYYTVRIARRLGPGATIYATDVKSEYLDQLRARLAREGITGVRLILGLPRDPGLPADSVDMAILSHMYHEIENPYEFLYRLQPSLAAGAKVAIIDMDRPTGSHGTPPALLRCELAAVGYTQLDFLPLTPADGYLAVFARPGTLPPAGAIKP